MHTLKAINLFLHSEKYGDSQTKLLVFAELQALVNRIFSPPATQKCTREIIAVSLLTTVTC